MKRYQIRCALESARLAADRGGYAVGLKANALVAVACSMAGDERASVLGEADEAAAEMSRVPNSLGLAPTRLRHLECLARISVAWRPDSEKAQRIGECVEMALNSPSSEDHDSVMRIVRSDLTCLSPSDRWRLWSHWVRTRVGNSRS